MLPSYTLRGDTHHVIPVRTSEQSVLEIGGEAIVSSLIWINEHEALLTLDDEDYVVYVAQDDTRIYVHCDGHTWCVEADHGFGTSGDLSGAGGGQVHSPMPGVVVAVNVAVGQAVEDGDVLMMIESMKMQTEIKATSSGTVSDIHYAAGDSFDKGALLIEVTAAEGDA